MDLHTSGGGRAVRAALPAASVAAALPAALVAAALLAALAAAAAPALAAGDVQDPTRVGGLLATLDARVVMVRLAAVDIVAGLPRLPAALAASFGRILGSTAHPPGVLLLLIAGSLAAAAAAMLALRVGLRGARRRAAEDPWRVRGAAVLLLLDAAERVVFLAAALAATRALFPGGALGEQLGVAVLWAAVRTGLFLLAADLLLRPDAPRLRPIGIADGAARRLWMLAAAALVVGVGGISVVPVLLLAEIAIEHAQAVALITGNAAAAIAAVGLVVFSRAAGAGPAPDAGGRPPGPLLQAGLWTALVLVAASWTIGALLIRFAPFHDLVGAVAVLGAVAAFDALMSFPPPQGASIRARSWLPAARRVVIVAALTAAGIQAVQSVLIGYVQVLDPATWADMREALVRSALVVVAGYAGWTVFSQWTKAKIAQAAPHGPGADDDTEPGGASRLATVLPLARTLGGAAVAVVLSFVVLSELGVDTAPLIAGAGIFGLAISFGSQALVKDVVSGVFFMVEDAFRVGEYIEAGELRGTVERIQTRSIRVRHQSGHLHTIPFGQIDTVTNLSRDWTTMRFEIRLARDVDIEKVRRSVKRIGIEMLADPELGKDFILPMKLQGVKDVAEHALICRVKFTVRPVRPFWVQREALKRIIAAFRAEGIAFASNQVVVQGGEPSAAAALPAYGAETAGGGAAAQASAQRA